MTNKDKSIKLKMDENNNRNDNLLHSEIGFDRFSPAAHLLEDTNRIEKFSTGSSSLDNILGGGIETGSITQFYGGPGSGKSQICLTLCALLPNQYNVVYIDTEGKFRPERIEQILKERTLESTNALKRIHISKPADSQGMERAIDNVSNIIDSNAFIKLLIVDSIINHLTIEYQGRSELPLRQQKLNLLMSKLQKIATEKKVAVVITNHIQSDPTPFHNELPVGGNILNFTSTHIVSLKKNRNNTHACLIKSNYLPYDESYFIVTGKGIENERYKDKKGNRKIKIRKVSSISSYRQELKKQEQNLDKSLNDTFDNTFFVPSNDNDKNQAKNNGFGRFDGFDDDLHIKVKEHLSKEGKSHMCHHKNCNNKEYFSLKDYNIHCLSKHPKQPMYPDLSLIKITGLEPKGNPREC